MKNPNLQNARKAYWADIHRIRSERGCNYDEARRLHNQNGHSKPATGGGESIDDLTPEQLTTLALKKAKEAETKIGELEWALTGLRTELERWNKLGNALAIEEAQPEAAIA